MYNDHFNYLLSRLPKEEKSRYRRRYLPGWNKLVPRGWQHAGKVDIVDGHATMYFPGKGTNGGGYHVSWDGHGEPHWTDDGLPKGHPDRHRDPRR